MFRNVRELLFHSVEQKISKADNPYTILTVADPVNYQKLEFFVKDGARINGEQGKPVAILLEAERNGYQTSFTCIECLPAKAPV